MYANPPPPYYANLENDQNAGPPPPYNYNIPHYPTKYKKKSGGSSCCRVENLQVKTFSIQPDFSLNTELELSVRADNPSKRVGFIYGDNNWVDVTFKDISICSGKAHGFHQGHENTTVVKVDLKGKSRFDLGLQQAFNESLTKHWIPLLVKLRVSINIIHGETTLREIKAFINCRLVLDNLAPNSTVGIISKDTRVHFEL